MATLNFGVRLVCTGKHNPPAGNGRDNRLYTLTSSRYTKRDIAEVVELELVERKRASRSEGQEAIATTTIPPVWARDV